MAITGLQIINSTDKLQSGFRAKFNTNADLLITDFTDLGDGTFQVTLKGGDTFIVPQTDSFFIKQEVLDLIAAINPAVWGSITGNVEDQTDVRGFLGQLDDLDPINDRVTNDDFTISATHPDNPFAGSGCYISPRFAVDGMYGQHLATSLDRPARQTQRARTAGVWSGWNLPITGTSNASGEADLSSYTQIPDYPNVTIYDAIGVQSAAQYDSANKKIIGLNPSESFTFRYN